MAEGVFLMIDSVPWRLVIWAGAGLCALYFLGWAVFGPPRRARRLLVNGVSALAAVGAWNLTMGALGLGVQVNLALLTAGAALGIPGAALIGVLQRMAQG